MGKMAVRKTWACRMAVNTQGRECLQSPTPINYHQSTSSAIFYYAVFPCDADRMTPRQKQVDPKHGEGNKVLWQGIGEARYNQGKWDTASEAFNSVLYYESESENAKAWLVRTLLGAERWQEAVNKAKEVVGQHQHSGELRGLLQEAEKQLKMSLRKDYYKVWEECGRLAPGCRPHMFMYSLLQG